MDQASRQFLSDKISYPFSSHCFADVCVFSSNFRRQFVRTPWTIVSRRVQPRKSFSLMFATFSPSMHVSYDDCIADSSNNDVNLLPHHCNQCPYSTFVSSFIERHRSSGDRYQGLSVPSARPDRFDCNECEYSFSTERHLALHSRLKHRKASIYVNKAPRGPVSMQPNVNEDKMYFGAQDLNGRQGLHVNSQFSQSPIQEASSPVHEDGISPKTVSETQESSDVDPLVTSPPRAVKPRNFSCSVCSYRATQKSALNVHFRRHTGEKPYACRTCDYKCAALNSLVVHNRTHTGEKPYKCQVCGKAFTQSGSLKAHHRVHKIA